MKGLIWFRHDLRLSDNPALISITKNCTQSLMLFVINPDWFRTNSFHCRHLGYFREIFLYQTLRELDLELKKYDQKLVIKVGDPKRVIPNLCKKHGIDLVTVTEHFDLSLKAQIEALEQSLPSCVQRCDSYSLFLAHQIKYDKQSFPQTFEQFHQYIIAHNLLPCIPINTPDSLPRALKEDSDHWNSENFFQPLPYYHGGEDAAFMRLKEFFWKTAGLQKYHQSINDIEGIHSTSRFSAWLANGSISPRTLAAELDKYEYRYGSDDSSKAMYISLLRREYFQWKMRITAPSLAKITQKLELSGADLASFQAWRSGNTAFPFVNACMKQLNNVGFLSATARKVVASCLVNQLGVDWRYGAAYFEQQLIDHDLAINRFSWQQLSEQKNAAYPVFTQELEQTMREHDPHGSFTAKWIMSSDKALQK